jgi:membrane protease YdiL (CAAX protease family)
MLRTVRGRALIAMLLVVPVQSLGAASMLFVFPGIEGKLINGICRLWMLAVPLVWTILVERSRPRIFGPRRRDLVVGLVSGLLIFVVMMGSYLLLGRFINVDALTQRARVTGFLRPLPFAIVFLYVILINSLLEEYVWRWFVYRHVETLMPKAPGEPARRVVAVMATALLFTVHHVIALSAWVGPLLVGLGSFGVFMGALIWSAIYARERSIWPCYISHVLADFAILLIAYDLLFRAK